jgi:UDP-N-acetylmuramoyl-tripeptide--D-alanyl-D-alanine ligase
MLSTVREYFSQATFEQISEDQPFKGLCHDTRFLRPGEIFIALQGEHAHGLVYAKQAYDAGALAVLIDEQYQNEFIGPKIIVTNVFEAAYRCAALKRQHYPFKIAAVTGTAGKTSTKEYMAQLAFPQQVFVSFANWNNMLGLIVNLSRLDHTIPYNLFELGISLEGEMEALVELLKPDIAVITTIGSGHLSGLKNLQGVAHEKEKIAHYAQTFLTTKQARPYLKTHKAWKIVDYNLEQQQCVLNLKNAQLNTDFSSEGCCYQIRSDGLFYPSLWLLAIQVLQAQEWAYSFDSSTKIHIPSGRGSFLMANEIMYIDDTYNANPLSVKALYEHLQTYQKPALLILGDLAELGAGEDALLEDIARMLQNHYLIECIYIGKHQVKMEALGLTVLNHYDDLRRYALRKNPKIIALKGSRVSRLEELLSYFLTADKLKESL